MPTYKMTLEYDGTRYRGWQVQKESRTIQGTCLDAIGQATGSQRFDFQGSGRTDAGVHALRQTAHLQIERTFETDLLRQAINDALPADIHILSLAKAPNGFHARHDAVARSYLYQICVRRTAFGKKWVWWVKDPLDVTVMQRMSRHLVGMKNFRSFTPVDGESESKKVELRRVDVGRHGDLILIRLVGSHFLWKMVRQAVGVLVQAGRGLLTEGDLLGFLSTYSHRPSDWTAPPSGLFLENVFYKGDRILEELRPAFFTQPTVPLK